MEFAACLIGGLALMVCGGALFRLRPPNWHSDGELLGAHRTVIERWGMVQRVIRLLNNSLLIVVGVMIFSTAFLAHGRLWMVMWSLILLLLLLAIVFAMVDALSSLAGYRRALPEAARRSFSNSDLSLEHTELAEVGCDSQQQ